MIPSQNKKNLKAKLTEYNASYHKIEMKQSHLKALIITDDEMEFDHLNDSGEDDDNANAQ